MIAAAASLIGSAVNLIGKIKFGKKKKTTVTVAAQSGTTSDGNQIYSKATNPTAMDNLKAGNFMPFIKQYGIFIAIALIVVWFLFFKRK